MLTIKSLEAITGAVNVVVLLVVLTVEAVLVVVVAQCVVCSFFANSLGSL